MEYVKTILGFELIVAKTGIKYLHQKAKKFDLAFYFEANGHGTVYTKKSSFEKIDSLNTFVESSADGQVLQLLCMFLSIFNRTTGDSLSALIASECSLKLLNMNINDLYSIYEELSSVALKVVVKDKSIFLPNEDESRLISPIELQTQIDEIIGSESKARLFVRPSGTEDVIRIYVEAKTKESALELSLRVKNVIMNLYS